MTDARPTILPPGQAQPGYAIGRAVLFMVLAMMLLPCLNAIAKLLTADYSIPQIVWARYAGHLLFMILMFTPRRGIGLFRTSKPALQVTRSLLLFVSTVCYFSALIYIPLPTAVSINFIGPIIVTALSVPLLGEQVGIRRWAAVAVGFLGALLIIRPGADGLHWAGLLVIGSASSYALYQVLSRRLASHDPADTSITYVALVGAAVATLAVPFYWQDLANAQDFLLFLGLGLFGGLGHYCVVLAYQWGPASVVAPFNYGQLLGATLLGYLLFGDFPDGWTWMGAAVIVGSGLYIMWRERLRGRPRPVVPPPSPT